MPLYLSVYLSVYVSICVFIYLSWYLTICRCFLSIYLSIYRPIYSSSYLSISLSIYLSVCLPVCLSVYLSIYLSMRLCERKQLCETSFKSGSWLGASITVFCLKLPESLAHPLKLCENIVILPENCHWYPWVNQLPLGIYWISFTIKLVSTI